MKYGPGILSGPEQELGDLKLQSTTHLTTNYVPSREIATRKQERTSKIFMDISKRNIIKGKSISTKISKKSAPVTNQNDADPDCGDSQAGGEGQTNSSGIIQN